MVPHYVGYYGQQIRALLAFRFYEVLWITGMLRGMSMKAARHQATQLMERFEATALAPKIMARLSGGEARLCGILASFMGERPILILDEPTNDLDPVRRQILWSYLHERNVTDGTTVIVVSHNLSEVETVAHQAALINKGKVLATGSIGELKRMVADKVRIEVRLRQEIGNLADVLLEVGTVRQARPSVWEVYTDPSAAPSLLQTLLETLGTEVIDDFRLITPTLDDVYLYFTRRNEQQ